jgi:SAM-dependent methyltransferase
VRLVADAQLLPLENQSLRGIVMCDVLHHIPHPRRFFSEATRCVRRGGVITMIEPWVTPWSRIVYRYLHHEPFSPDAVEWDIPGSGPLSGANGALPWILFRRDRLQFEREFPQWEIHRIEPFMPLRYLLSGGVSKRGMMPGFTFPLWRALEYPFRGAAGMFAKIILIKRD